MDTDSDSSQRRQRGARTSDKAGKRRHPVARIKGGWTEAEDARLVRLVEEHGEGSWSSISKSFPGRIGKQCRERWHNQLRPDIRRDAWTNEEEALLAVAHSRLGNKWADISKSIPGRTENSVKNHWNATLRRRLLPDTRQAGETTCLRIYMVTLDLDDPAASRRTAGGGVRWSSGGRTLGNKRWRTTGTNNVEASSSASEADSDCPSRTNVGSRRVCRSGRQLPPPPGLLPTSGRMQAQQTPAGGRQPSPTLPPHPRQAAEAESRDGSGFRQPDLDDAAAAQAQTLSPIFPGLVFPATGATPACEQLLCGLDAAMMRAHSTPLPHASLQAACGCRASRLFHTDGAGLVDPGWDVGQLDHAIAQAAHALEDGHRSDDGEAAAQAFAGVTSTPIMQQLLCSIETPRSPRKAVALQRSMEPNLGGGSTNLAYSRSPGMPRDWLPPPSAAGPVSPFSIHAPPGSLPSVSMTSDERRLSVCSNGVVGRIGSAACEADCMPSPSDIVLPRMLFLPSPQVHEDAGLDVAAPFLLHDHHAQAELRQEQQFADEEGPEASRTHLEVSIGPILEAEAYTSRLDLSQQAQAATYRGIGPPLPVGAIEEAQLAAAVWRICEQTRAAFGPQVGDIIVALRLMTDGRQDAGQPNLAVAVAAASSDAAMHALQHIVQLAVRLSATSMWIHCTDSQQWTFAKGEAQV